MAELSTDDPRLCGTGLLDAWPGPDVAGLDKIQISTGTNASAVNWLII